MWLAQISGAAKPRSPWRKLVSNHWSIKLLLCLMPDRTIRIGKGITAAKCLISIRVVTCLIHKVSQCVLYLQSLAYCRHILMGYSQQAHDKSSQCITSPIIRWHSWYAVWFELGQSIGDMHEKAFHVSCFIL